MLLKGLIVVWRSRFEAGHANRQRKDLGNQVATTSWVTRGPTPGSIEKLGCLPAPMVKVSHLECAPKQPGEVIEGCFPGTIAESCAIVPSAMPPEQHQRDPSPTPFLLRIEPQSRPDRRPWSNHRIPVEYHEA